MSFFTRRRALWLAFNLAAALIVPITFGWWLDVQVHGSDATLPEGFDPGTVVLVFTIAWATFLLLLNVTMAVFLSLKKR
jgi:hypothetical protein